MRRQELSYYWKWLRVRWQRVRGARSPHPAIGRHWRERIDAAQAKRAADADEPFALRLGDDAVEIRVRPAPVFSEQARATVLSDDEEPEQFDVTDVVTYAGRVAGDDESDVRLTITGSTLTGYVLTRGDWWFIEPMRRFDREAAQDQYLVYRTKDLAFRHPFGSDAKPAGVEPAGGTAEGHRTNPHIGIALWADLDYRTQANIIGMNWWDAQAAVINNVNGIYRREVDLEFVVRVFVLHIGSVLSSTNADTLLDQLGIRVRAFHGDLRQMAVRQRTGIEVAHLTSGKNLDGNTLGIAWQPGAWSLSQQALFWIGGGGLFGGPNLSFHNMMVAAHELGHNFTGDHGAAEEICVAHFIFCWDYERTIMWPTYYSDNRDEFSDANDTRIKTNAATGRNVNYVHS